MRLVYIFGRLGEQQTWFEWIIPLTRQFKRSHGPLIWIKCKYENGNMEVAYYILSRAQKSKVNMYQIDNW